jgi:hypothetical protein
VVCYDFGCRKVTQLRGRKAIRMIRGDLYFSLDVEVTEIGGTAQKSNKRKCILSLVKLAETQLKLKGDMLNVSPTLVPRFLS